MSGFLSEGVRSDRRWLRLKGGALYAVYFSPTGGTRRCVRLIAGRMGEILGREAVGLDLTGSERRKQRYSFGGEDLVVLGAPVYAGRVPNKILPDLEAGLGGAGDIKIVPVSVYGNRSCGEALRELIVLTERNGFVPIGGAAVVSRHVFSQTLAAGRPDPSDGAELAAFGERMARRVKTGGAGVERGSDPSGRPLLYPAERGRYACAVFKGKASYRWGAVRRLRPVQRGLPYGQHLPQRFHPSHRGVHQVPGLYQGLSRRGEVL